MRLSLIFALILNAAFSQLSPVADDDDEFEIDESDHDFTTGLDGFKNLIKTLETLVSLGHITADRAAQLSKQLIDSRDYLLTDFRKHVAEENPSALIHNRKWALSDGRDPDFNQPVDTSFYRGTCSHCNTFHKTLSEITKIVDDAKIEDGGRIYWTVKRAVDHARGLAGHFLREVHENKARARQLKGMTERQVLILCDLAAPWDIHRKGIEADEYGNMDEILWTTCVAFWRKNNKLYRRNFVHVFDTLTDTFESGLSYGIISDILARIKREMPQIDEALVWSDTAPLYFSKSNLVSMPALLQKNGIHLKRWDFGESQNGRGECDRFESRAKSHLSRLIESGVQCSTPDQFAGNLATAKIPATSVIRSRAKVVSKGKPKVPYFDECRSFEFDKDRPDEVRVWKAHGIGRGKVVKNADWTRQGVTVEFTTQVYFDDANWQQIGTE